MMVQASGDMGMILHLSEQAAVVNLGGFARRRWMRESSRGGSGRKLADQPR